ncbi:hypothetical protein AN963_00295 [Brevibacillus choshinensis]|uniref:Peptidase M20 dimerisation domain-containing protein n=1 Tax=Brevibacillus choshinensis TaxID=54911 RepID=A0ABR5N9S5_BRECH|nr:Zn-dependent hydrolase [Brevibacillus choshinensis]KQL48300.1 hypothetical protein AN963_00295 [Brevibacillus choshinensis]
MQDLRINLDRVKKNLQTVGLVANSGQRGYTRLAYSQEEKKALHWLKRELSQLPVTVCEDNIGNVFGRWGDVNRPAIAFGSHLDTVPEGGLFDGALGVIIGLECLHTLIENQYKPEVPLELICFVGEEANPLGGTFGSRAVTGLLEYSKELELKLKKVGYTWEDVVASKRTSNDYRCFLELHIEQGGVLETNDKKIGVVTSIAGIRRLFVQVHGRASHSGTTPMSLRKDALVDASRLVQKVNELAVQAKGDIVATVGELSVFPNLANVVPGEAELMIEIRGSKLDEMMTLERSIRDWIDKNMDAEISVAVQKDPSQISDTIQSCIEEICRSSHIPSQSMFSGANHDANAMNTITDVGMIFVPSKDGISHHPDEFTSWEDIEVGGNVMLKTLQSLTRKYT